MGFGTGHHASTRLCLRWLQSISVAGTRVIDVGTGSGVLAIAAVILGARAAVGIDFDEDAITAARENVELNGVGGQVELRASTLEAAADRDSQFDVVIANITGALIAREADKLRALARATGVLIASGFQTSELDHVTGALEAAGWSADAEIEEDTWLGVLYRASLPAPARPE
jgi:ribosomal protein L11 methyltransferase